MKTMRRSIILAIVLAVTAAPAAAFAQQDTGGRDATTTSTVTDERDHRLLDELKARALQMIDHQLDALGRLRSAIGNSAHITDDHAVQLLGDISAAAADLEQLAREIEAATTVPEVWQLIRQIPGFQIGNVLAPKTHQVIASDSLVAFGGKLDRFAAKLEGLITRAEENGHDVDEAWRMLEDMNGQIAEGVRSADPVAESVIGLQADDWPDPAQSVLGAGRRDLHAAGQSLRGAYGTGKGIVEFLRNLFDVASDV